MFVLVSGVALLLAFNYLRVLQADGYKALYDGRWIALHGVPHMEALTAGAGGRQWVDQADQPELFSYETWRLGGYALLAIVSGASIAAAYAILAAAMRRRGASIVAAICFSVLAALSLVGWSFVRAQNFALPLFALVLVLCLYDAEHSRLQRRVILLVPLLVLWANVHGSVLLGACLSCLYALYRAARMGRERAWRDAGTYVGLAADRRHRRWRPVRSAHPPLRAEFVGNKAMRAAATEWDPPAIGSMAMLSSTSHCWWCSAC